MRDAFLVQRSCREARNVADGSVNRKSGRQPVPKWIAKWIALKQKAIQVEPLTQARSPEVGLVKSRPQATRAAAKKEQGYGSGRTKRSESGALHSSIVVWSADPDKHGPCVKRREYIRERRTCLDSLPLWPFGLDQV